MAPITLAEYKEELLTALRAGVDRLIPEGVEVGGLDQPLAVAERMLAGAPRGHVYDEQIGPFYDIAGGRGDPWGAYLEA